jgi:hypothetical protein
MSSIFDLIYREYCRARLAEMRKQLLIPIASDEILEAHRDGGDAGPVTAIASGRRSRDETGLNDQVAGTRRAPDA